MKLTRSRQVTVLLLLAAVAVVLLIIQPDEEPSLRSLAPSPVLVSRSQRVDLQPVEVVSGRLQPARRAWLRFEVGGRVAERSVEPGQRVAESQPLLSLDDRDYQDALIQAQADLSQAKENLTRDRQLLKLAIRSRELQEAEVARLNSLKERSLASKTRLGDSQALLAQRQSEEARLRTSVDTGPQIIAARKAATNRAQRNLERAILRAPFDAYVNQVELEAGDYAERNQQAVELIGDEMDFSAQVRGSLARALEIGSAVTVTVDGAVFTAVVISIQPDPDPTTFTHAIRLRMPDGETRSGAVAVAHLPMKPLTQALVVPTTAVLLDEGGSYVFQVANEQLHRVPIELGPRVGRKQVILAGLEAGDSVVVRDVAALSDGQAVIPEAVQDVDRDE